MTPPTYIITVPDSCLEALALAIQELIISTEWGWQPSGLPQTDETILQDYYELYYEITTILKYR